MLIPAAKLDNMKIVHQLNNEGCLCQMCQKIIMNQNTHIVVIEKFTDINSQQFNPFKTKEYYIKIIKEMYQWEKKPRKLRYLLPQICLYSNANPIQRLGKRQQSGGMIYIRDKAKMHMFQIIHFFLEGYIYHKNAPSKNINNVGVITNKRPKPRARGSKNFPKQEQVQQQDHIVGIYSQKHKNECIVIAKYKNNFFNMFTLAQMESLFKSRQKYLREGLIYLQTLVGTRQNSEINISLDLRTFMGTELYQRAKKQVRMILEQIKTSDMDFILEDDEINYQNQLKVANYREYLQYLSLKIILLQSKGKQSIISKAVFKYVSHRGYEYLWDIRVDKFENTQQFWAAGMMKAFQYRLHRKMSMMEINPETEELGQRVIGKRARDLTLWLKQSTEMQWSEMKTIKNRLDKLESQKRSLMQTQSFTEGQIKSTFKIRNIKKK